MTFNYYLHSKTFNSGEKSIYLNIKHQYKKVRIFLNTSIDPKFWNNKTQTVKTTKAFPQGLELNTQLAQTKQKAINVYNRFVSENGKQPELKELKSLIQESLTGKLSTKEIDLLTFYEQYIPTLDNKLNNSGRPFTQAYKGSVRNTYLKLMDFKEISKKSVAFNDIDNSFYNDFITYLNTLDYKANYIGKQVKNLCTVLNEATTLGVNNNFKFKNFKIIEETSTEIYLNEEELNEMKNLDLDIGSNIDKARDLFLFSAWTGLRYSDISNFNERADIKADIFSFKVQKTQKPITIPILPVTKEILGKHSNKLPLLSNPQFNKLLKEIGEMMPSLSKKIKIEFTKGGKLQTEDVVKHTLLKAHSGRRSFATNMVYRRMSINLIMAITGHSKESNFTKYIKLSTGYKADQFLDEFNKI